MSILLHSAILVYGGGGAVRSTSVGGEWVENG